MNAIFLNDLLIGAGFFAAVAALSWFATRLVLAYLERRAILDQPNERSSHTRPTPRGGGIAVTAVLLLVGALLLVGLSLVTASLARLELSILLLGMALLALLSWLDDLWICRPPCALPAIFWWSPLR